MKLSANAEAIFNDMNTLFKRFVRRIEQKELFKAGLDAYLMTGYKEAIVSANDNDMIGKDDTLCLCEALRTMLINMHNLLNYEKEEL